MRIAGTLAIVALCAGVATELRAQDRARDTARAVIEVLAVSGERTDGDAASAQGRAESLLRRCARQGREAPGAQVRVALSVDAAGAAAPAAMVDEVLVMTEAETRFSTCVVRALARVRLAPGGTGTIELRVRWHEPRNIRRTTSFGGLRGRQGDLPIRMRGAAVTGPRPYPRAQLVEVVRQHNDEIQRCLAAAIERAPDTEGTLGVQLTIRADGSAGDVVATSDPIGLPSLTACVLARIATWTFPPPDGGVPVVVTHQFALHAAAR